jgi:hypothetical protein
LIYRIKVENCSKICLRAIIDPFGKYIHTKCPKLSEYLILAKRKLPIDSRSPDSILLWEVGEAKVKIEPVVLTATCSECRCGRNVGVVSDYYCSILCINSECKKQIIVQFVEIVLY